MHPKRFEKRKMTYRIVLPALALTVALASGLGASAEESSLPVPSEKKREVINQLFELSGVEQQAEESIANMSKIIGKNLRATLLSKLKSNKELTDEQKQEKASTQADKIMEVFKSKLDMREELLTLFASLYDKHFTEEELKFMLDFYKSPAGKKFMEDSPAVMKEASVRLKDQLNPRVNELMAKKLSAMEAADDKEVDAKAESTESETKKDEEK